MKNPIRRRHALTSLARLAMLAALGGIGTLLAAREPPPGCRTRCRQCPFFKNGTCLSETKP